MSVGFDFPFLKNGIIRGEAAKLWGENGLDRVFLRDSMAF
jgi:hypothetical protein